MVLYRSTKGTGFNSKLDVLVFLIELSSNVNELKTISTKRPLVKNYIEYRFSDGKLRIARDTEDGRLVFLFCIGINYVVEITKSGSCAASCVWLLDGDSQVRIDLSGTSQAMIITNLSDGFFKEELFNPLYYVSSICQLIDGIFSEIQIERKTLMPLKEEIEFIKKYDNFRFERTGGKFFENNRYSLKGSGFECL